MSREELVIWVYHMCREKRFVEALTTLESVERKSAFSALAHLLKAVVYGQLRQFARKKKELALFKRVMKGSQVHIRNELREFGEIFGRRAVETLGRRLAISNPGVEIL